MRFKLAEKPISYKFASRQCMNNYNGITGKFLNKQNFFPRTNMMMKSLIKSGKTLKFFPNFVKPLCLVNTHAERIKVLLEEKARPLPYSKEINKNAIRQDIENEIFQLKTEQEEFFALQNSIDEYLNKHKAGSLENLSEPLPPLQRGYVVSDSQREIILQFLKETFLTFSSDQNEMDNFTAIAGHSFLGPLFMALYKACFFKEISYQNAFLINNIDDYILCNMTLAHTKTGPEGTFHLGGTMREILISLEKNNMENMLFPEQGKLKNPNLETIKNLMMDFYGG